MAQGFLRFKELSRSLTQTSELNENHLFKFRSRLLPILQDSHDSIIESDPNIPLVMEHTLDIPVLRIAGLSVQPGEDHFIWWFTISSYFPLISACLGPMANMLSIIALIQHWRYDTVLKRDIPDLPEVIVLNTLSLCLGILGNVSLLLNFTKIIKYLVTQTISILCWLIACTFLIAAIFITNKQFTMENSPYLRSEGFWMAVFTAFFYLCCALILLINFLGYHLKKYPPTFNLNQKQRSLMIYTITFCGWCIIGSAAMQHLINDLTYGAALYYCIVSFLTIGLGDIVPRTTIARSIILILSLAGVINMGLIVAMIRQVVLKSSGPTIFWHQIEKERMKKIDQLLESDTQMDSESSFHAMRVIRRRASREQVTVSLIFTIIIFCCYWLIGAAIFKSVEDWSYFEGVYFCFLCLLTIGYGDLAPKSAFGRVFFVSWAITAVPLMTILISNMGDKLFDISDSFSEHFSKMFFKKHYEEIQKKKREIEQQNHLDSIENAVSDQEAEEDIQIDEDMSDDPTKSLENEEVENYQDQADKDDQFKNSLANYELNQTDCEQNDHDQPITNEHLTAKSKDILHQNSQQNLPLENLNDPGENQNVQNPQIKWQTCNDKDYKPEAQMQSSKVNESKYDSQSVSRFDSILTKPLAEMDDEELNMIKKNTKERLESHEKNYKRMLNQINDLKPLIFDSLESPNKKYNHDQWSSILNYTEDESTQIQKMLMDREVSINPRYKLGNPEQYTRPSQSNLYWLSDKSPLRLPIKEPNYLVLKTYFKIEANLQNLIQMELKDRERLQKYYEHIMSIRKSNDLINDNNNNDDDGDDDDDDDDGSDDLNLDMEQTTRFDSEYSFNQDLADSIDSSSSTKVSKKKTNSSLADIKEKSKNGIQKSHNS